MSNTTCFATCVLIVCATIYLAKPSPVSVETKPPMIAVAAVAIPEPIVEAPVSTRHYNRLPNGKLVPAVDETPQQFDQANTESANDPLAAKPNSDDKEIKHHTTDDLINGVNSQGL